jgi:hypothetical protein
MWRIPSHFFRLSHRNRWRQCHEGHFWPLWPVAVGVWSYQVCCSFSYIIKIFFLIDIQLYQHSWKLEKLHSNSTRVDNVNKACTCAEWTENVLYFLNITQIANLGILLPQFYNISQRSKENHLHMEIIYILLWIACWGWCYKVILKYMLLS